jgi:tetratricopeptide (TPR) repeat protein
VLAKVPGLRVAARTSAFYFKDKNVPIPEIAQKLNVAYVVEGSVQKSGTRVKITAQLIKAADGFHVWSDTFTRELKDVFAMQDEIAGLIAKQLQLTLGDAPRVAKTVNPEAHRLVLEGRFFWNQRSEEGFARAEADFKRALEIDPDFAEAHAGLAGVFTMRSWYRIMAGNATPAEGDVARAKEEVRRAKALNPQLAEPSASLGIVLMNELKFEESERQFAEAITLDPNDTIVRHWHSNLLAAEGRLDEAVNEIARSLSLDPLYSNALWAKAYYFGHAGRTQEALDATERALALRPGHPTILSERALALWKLGRRDDAIASARGVGRDLTAQPRWLADPHAIYVLRLAGLQAEAEAYAERALANVPKDDYRYGTTLVALGRGKEALQYLRTLNSTALISVYWNPMWDSLREDAQFQQWLVTIGCAEQYKLARETQARMLKEQAGRK